MTAITIGVPGWLAEMAPAGGVLPAVDDRMGLVIELARRNVTEGGGPFGAAVFELEAGRLVAAGVNCVVPGRNALLHAEVMALMGAHAALGSHTLAPIGGGAAHELVTSCDPCAMCLGATLWSGVRRLVCGATREDALAVGFDEGPVFPASLDYLAERGIEIRRAVRREDARAVLVDYGGGGGRIYNP